jgi:hypothetical protein
MPSSHFYLIIISPSLPQHFLTRHDLSAASLTTALPSRYCLSPSHPLTLSPSHPLTLSPSHHLTLSPSHPLTLFSPSHPLTLSPSHPLTLSPSHPLLTLSPSHPLTLLPSYPRSTAETAYSHLNCRVPDDCKYPLHILMVEHGKRCVRCAKGGKLQLPEEGPCPLLNFDDKVRIPHKRIPHKRDRSGPSLHTVAVLIKSPITNCNCDSNWTTSHDRSAPETTHSL